MRRTSTVSQSRWWAFLALPVIAAVAWSPAIAADDVAAARVKLDGEYAAKFAALANKFHSATALKKVPAEFAARDSLKYYVFRIVPSYCPPRQPVALPPEELYGLRRQYGAALFALAGKALDVHQAGLAYELIRSTLHEDPDHERARAIMGYEYDMSAERWATAYEAKRLANGQVFDDKFGWLAAADVPRYEKGERKSAGGVWRLAADDAKQHATIKTGWRIETEHYVVTTDLSLEGGVQLAKKLELLNQVWRQVFAGYWLSESELSKRYAGAALPQHQSKQHQVVYFGSREEYNATLRPMQPMIEKTIGYYVFDNHTAYFFAGDAADDAVLFHEGTHQLFQEMRPVNRDLPRKDNFWVVEAIACYMESLAIGDEFCTTGGADAGRIPAARKRVIDDGFYVPLAEMVTFNRDTLQHDNRVAKIYSQSAGLANFLMHADGGRYRQPLIDYLIAVYSGKADAGTLSKLTGSSYSQLDEAYRKYMQTLDKN